jgi:alpha-amylase
MNARHCLATLALVFALVGAASAANAVAGEPQQARKTIAADAAPTDAAIRRPRAKAGEEVFYHVFFRSFRDSDGDRIGDLKGLTEQLDYLQDLGITSILLTPLQPSPYYHNYFATDFERIEPAYGTMQDYRALLGAAHARGLKVYLDMEIQYVGEGHPWWARSLGKPEAPFADFLIWRDRTHTEAEPFLTQAKWEGYDGRHIGIAMVNLNDAKVREYFQRMLLQWADPHGDGSGRDGPDGFRIDHMMDDLDNKGVATRLFDTFWKPIFDALRQRRPDFRIMAEQYDWGYGADWLTRGHADLVFAFPLRGAIGKLDKAEIVKALRETERITPAGKSQIVFLENHDTDRLMSLLRGDPAKARAAAAIMLLARGEPLLYYGQELGMRGITGKFGMSDANHIPLREAMRWQADLDARGSATWYQGDKPWWTDRYNRSDDGVSVQEQDADPASLLNWYRRLLALRQARPELRRGEQRILCDDDSQLLCLLREDGGQRSLLVANLGDRPATPALDDATASAKWIDLMDAAGSGKPVDPKALSLPPMAVRILGTP